MSSSTTSASVAAGQTATYSVAVTPQGGLNETVSLTCNGAPARSTCTVSPSSVMLNGSTPTSVTVSVSTTAGSMTPPAGITLPPDASGFGRLIWLGCLLALSALAALATRKRQAGWLLGLSLMMLVFWVACGGAGGGGGGVRGLSRVSPCPCHPQPQKSLPAFVFPRYEPQSYRTTLRHLAYERAQRLVV